MPGAATLPQDLHRGMRVLVAEGPDHHLGRALAAQASQQADRRVADAYLTDKGRFNMLQRAPGVSTEVSFRRFLNDFRRLTLCIN